MKNFFRRINERMARFMYGRYGFDELSAAMDIAAFVLILLSYIPYTRWLSLFALAVIILSMCRGFSKNIAARRGELNKYYSIKKKVTDRLALRKRIWSERKTHVYFKCKSCGAMLRVPRGRGEIVVTCPKCGTKVDKRT